MPSASTDFFCSSGSSGSSMHCLLQHPVPLPPAACCPLPVSWACLRDLPALAVRSALPALRVPVSWTRRPALPGCPTVSWAVLTVWAVRPMTVSWTVLTVLAGRPMTVSSAVLTVLAVRLMTVSWAVPMVLTVRLMTVSSADCSALAPLSVSADRLTLTPACPRRPALSCYCCFYCCYHDPAFFNLHAALSPNRRHQHKFSNRHFC